MKHLPILLFAIFAFSVVNSSAQPTVLPPKENFHLILLVGQSNMAGRGKVTDQDKKPHPRVLMLTKDRKWVPALAPIHFDKPKAVGVGIGRSFAIDVAEANPGITIGLIPCGVGGSPIDSWVDGAYYSPTKSHPWDDAIARATQAMKSGTLVAILWHQGESDSKPGLSKTYEKKLHARIQSFRKVLVAPDVPFIAGQMGQFKERPWTKEKKQVDQAHRDIATKVPHAAFVNSDGLSHKGDQVHFDAASYRELGRRYAKAYLEMATKK